MNADTLEQMLMEEYAILSQENPMFDEYAKVSIRKKYNKVDCVNITYSVKSSDFEKQFNVDNYYKHRDIIINLIRNTIKTKKIKVNHYECFDNERMSCYEPSV